MTLRILFMGLVGSGKSYLANLCAKQTKGEVVTFAQEVYRLAEKVLQRKVDKSKQGDRELLKLIGTSWGREGKKVEGWIEDIFNGEWAGPHGYPNIWLDALIRHVESMPSGQSIFNDDTRFFNELTTLSSQLGFIPVYVACSETERIKRLTNRGEMKDPNRKRHKSEAMVNEIHNLVIRERGIPVLWNDDLSRQPKLDWVINVGEFMEEIARDPEELANKLNAIWEPGILSMLSNEVKNG